MDSFFNFVDRLNLFLAKLASKFILLMVFLTFLIVVLRYGFGLGWIWLQESVLYFHGIAFLLAAPYALLIDGHVRVDIFYRGASPNKKAVVDLFGSFFLLLPMCGLIFYQSFPYVLDSWKILEGSREAGGLDFVYGLKTFILIFCVLLFLQGLSQSYRSLKVIRGQNV